jgi:hypothetical protein
VDATGTDVAGIRWYELRNTGGAGWAINQQSTFSPDATNRWMGSIAMNGSGDIALGYSASSSTMFPAIRYTGRLATDPINGMTQGEGVLIAGTGAQTHTAARWGDYSMLSVDPADDCTFWFTSEYVKTTGSAPWVTRIGSFKLANCGAPGPTSTPGPTATPTNTPLPSTPTNTPAPVSSTGFLAPSANAPVTTSAGDNNGYQTSPTSAYVADGVFASDPSSGTNTNTSCTNAGKDKHLFYNFNITMPTLTAANGIEVKLNARVNNTGSAPKICVQLSWDGGTTWTTAKTTATLTTTNATYTLGTTVDNWGRAWALGNFSNTNFRVRVIDIASSSARTFYLDSIAVNVTYLP